MTAIQKIYMTIKEVGKKWCISGRMVTYYCVERRIPGVIRKGNMWIIPTDNFLEKN
jgi:hypothetical protein